MNRLLLSLSLCIGSVSMPTPVHAAPASAPAPQAHGGMVFVANTGLEDTGTLSSSLRHAIVAKESGVLEDVVWIVYGRAIVVLDPTVQAVPHGLRDDLAAARQAGVRVVACASALEKYGIDPAKLAVPAEVVPNGIVEVAKLVSRGYGVLRY